MTLFSFPPAPFQGADLPPYTDGSGPMPGGTGQTMFVQCRVCQNIIHVSLGVHTRVVKCSKCTEATVSSPVGMCNHTHFLNIKPHLPISVSVFVSLFVASPAHSPSPGRQEVCSLSVQLPPHLFRCCLQSGVPSAKLVRDFTLVGQWRMVSVKINLLQPASTQCDVDPVCVPIELFSTCLNPV